MVLKNHAPENDDHIEAAAPVHNRELVEISGRELLLFDPNLRNRICFEHDDRRDDLTASSDSTPTEISFDRPSYFHNSAEKI